jgi:hypothetical protein
VPDWERQVTSLCSQLQHRLQSKSQSTTELSESIGARWGTLLAARISGLV